MVVCSAEEGSAAGRTVAARREIGGGEGSCTRKSASSVSGAQKENKPSKSHLQELTLDILQGLCLHAAKHAARETKQSHHDAHIGSLRNHVFDRSDLCIGVVESQ